MLRYLTAGESHGPVLTAVLEGMPAGVTVDREAINRDLARRQQGAGRGGRMKIERDEIEILGGVRFGLTLGSPIALQIRNRDWENWEKIMAVWPLPGHDLDGTPAATPRVVTCPRPGHADLAGGLKYAHRDLRNVLERASARETAARVAVGALCRGFLAAFGVGVFSHVLAIGEVGIDPEAVWSGKQAEQLRTAAEESPVRCADPATGRAMEAAIESAREAGDSLGGVFEVVATGLPPGLGSHVHWDRRLDGRLAGAVMSIPAVKGVEIGAGFGATSLPGSRVHDEIFYSGERGFFRETNRAGGLEGGITNGEPVVVRGAMKPIPTLMRPLNSVDLLTRHPVQAARERSDVCAVPAAAAVGEAAVVQVLADAILEKFGGDHLKEILTRYQAYLSHLREF